MKTEVIYATKTGHSKKLASAIAQELSCTAQNITQKPALSQVDLLFLVGGIYGNQSLPELISFVKELNPQEIKKVVLITSSAGGSTTQTEIRNLLTQQGILVEKQEYVCKGSFLFVGFGHPKKNEIQEAVAFAKRIAIL